VNTVNDILEVLNDHGFTDTSLATKLSFLNATLRNFNSRAPWSFLETTLNLTFNGSSATPTNLPSNFRAAKVIVSVSDSRPLEPMRVENLEKGARGLITETGEPLFYYFIGRDLRFAPIPPSTFTARMTFLQRQLAVDENSDSTDILLPTDFWDVIVLGTLVRLYDLEDDPELSMRMQQHYEEGIQTAREELSVLQYDRPDLIVMGDWDDYDYE
jgi:hypothetical protein